MAGGIEGKRDRYADHSGDTFTIVVYVLADVAVDASLVSLAVLENRGTKGVLIIYPISQRMLTQGRPIFDAGQQVEEGA